MDLLSSTWQAICHIVNLAMSPNSRGLHKTVQALMGELEGVDELESAHSDGEILLHVFQVIQLSKNDTVIGK